MSMREHLAACGANRWVRRVGGGLVAVVCLVVGGWLIADYIASIPPDPVNDDAEVVVNFFFSDYFERLSAEDRRAYTEALMGRWASMDADQRERVEQAVSQRRSEDRDQARERMIELGRNFALSEAEQYLQQPPDQREAWLGRRMQMWEMFGHNPERARGGGSRDGQRPELTAERLERSVRFFQDEVMTRSNAPERAKLTTLMGAVMEHYQE